MNTWEKYFNQILPQKLTDTIHLFGVLNPQLDVPFTADEFIKVISNTKKWERP